MLIVVAILFFGIKYQNVWACVSPSSKWWARSCSSLAFAHDILVTEGLYLDSLSLLMAFIIGVIGSGICVYALGYMEDFRPREARATVARYCSPLMPVFLPRCFLIVFSNNMLWLFTGWEITTVCSRMTPAPPRAICSVEANSEPGFNQRDVERQTVSH